MEETERKLAKVYPEVKEWWEDGGNDTCEANQTFLEETIISEMIKQDHVEMNIQNDCFSTIRLDWCSKHDITRQLCYVMAEPCSGNTDDKQMEHYETEQMDGENAEINNEKSETKMDGDNQQDVVTEVSTKPNQTDDKEMEHYDQEMDRGNGERNDKKI